MVWGMKLLHSLVVLLRSHYTAPETTGATIRRKMRLM